MDHGRANSRGTILYGWIRIILVLIIFSLVFVFTLYRFAEKLIEEQIAAINSGLAAQMRSIMDNRLTETRAIGLEVSNAPYTSVLLGTSTQGPVEYSWAYRDMVEYFRVTEATHTYIDTLSVYFPQSGSVINSDGFFVLGDGELPGEIIDHTADFLAEAVTRPRWNTFDWIHNSDGSFFYMQLLAGGRPEYSPVLLVSFNKTDVLEVLEEIPARYGGLQCISDEDGTIIFSSGNEIGLSLPVEVISRRTPNSRSEILRGSGAFAVEYTELEGLACCSFIPEELYMAELRRLRGIFLAAASAAVGICLVLIAYFFAVHYRPLGKIITGFEESLNWNPEWTNEYRRIEEYSNRLLSTNSINREQLRQFEAGMNSRQLEMFLKGSVLYKELPSHLRFLEDCRRPGSLRMIYLKLRGSGLPSEILSLYISEITADLPQGWRECFKVFLDEGAVLLLSAGTSDETKNEGLIKHLETSGTSLTKRTGFVPLTVISPPFFSVEEVSAQYKLCVGRMEEVAFFMVEKTALVATNVDNAFICLDQEDQKSLSEAIREGSYDNAADRISKILEQIETGSGACLDSARCLLFSTMTTVVQTISSTPAGTGDFMTVCNPLIARFFNSPDIRLMKEALDEMVRLSCEEISSRRRDYSKRVFVEIKNYVESNLQDREMYLPSIARRFGMNPKYLTVFFKEIQGIPLAEYIRRERVKKACRLILEGAAVKQAAREAGFANIVSFNRVFKAVKKMTPTEFRREAEMRNLRG